MLVRRGLQSDVQGGLLADIMAVFNNPIQALLVRTAAHMLYFGVDSAFRVQQRHFAIDAAGEIDNLHVLLRGQVLALLGSVH